MAFTSTYMMNYRPSVLALNSDHSAARVASYLIPNIYPHYRILDVGCGSGSVTLDLAALVPFGSVVGIDSNPRAIEAARQSGNVRDLCNYEFRTGDAYRLEWEQGSFDAVHAHQYLVHLRDPAKALMEMRRVCKIGGVVAVRDGTSQSHLSAFSSNHSCYSKRTLLR
jgi:ubiquinone/menaquinone biosynthesis C-methylase UbiE